MTIKELIKKAHGTAKEKGFYDKERNFGELLMLVTSELGEALEAHRKNRWASVDKFDTEIRPTMFMKDDRGEVVQRVESPIFTELFKEHVKDTVEDEIADAVIRLMDLAGGLGIDLEKHIQLKMAYNSTRERLHGKKY